MGVAVAGSGGPGPEAFTELLALAGDALCTAGTRGRWTERFSVMVTIDAAALTGTRAGPAVLARDGGCAFTGCTARHHLHLHHILHWQNGGATDIDNLVLLCRHHRKLTTPTSPPHRCSTAKAEILRSPRPAT